MINELLEKEVERLTKQIEEMKPIYDWAVRNGINNFDVINKDAFFTTKPTIVGEHVRRFYNLFHWNENVNLTLHISSLSTVSKYIILLLYS